MGRYGHHNNHSRYVKRGHQMNDDGTEYVPRPNNPDHKNSNQPIKIHRETEQDEYDDQPNIISRIGHGIKERYQQYNSEEARGQREQRKTIKRQKTIHDLSYNAKKEGLKAQIRKSRQVAPTNIFGIGTASSKGRAVKSPASGEGYAHLPKNNFGSMDRMFGIGNSPKPARVQKAKSNGWGNMDRMLGGY